MWYYQYAEEVVDSEIVKVVVGIVNGVADMEFGDWRRRAVLVEVCI